MREYFLEALREIFIEAIAAHKFIELKYNRNQNNEIKRLKHKWREIITKLLSNESEVKVSNVGKLNPSNFNIQYKLDKIEYELELIKKKVIEQQNINNQILNQIEKQLAILKTVSQTKDDPSILENTFYTFANADIEFEDIFSGLKFQILPDLSNNTESSDPDLESLRKQLDDL